MRSAREPDVEASGTRLHFTFRLKRSAFSFAKGLQQPSPAPRPLPQGRGGGVREEIVLATKVGGGHGALRNLRADTIERGAHASLERLQTDRIDLYYAHFDDKETELEESLRAFDALVKAGTVRHNGASNYTPERLAAALDFQRTHGLAEFTVLQPHYNLVERDFERTLLPVAEAWDLAVLPYFALAKGF